jgi:2-iminobutanoate/2-iminopropanoate deaminase
MKMIQTPSSAASKGHYSPAVVHGDLVYVSGVLPLDQAAGQTTPTGGVEDQTRLALKNLDAVLGLAGSDRSHVLKATVYVADIALWPAVNAVYAEFFGEAKPARTVVPTAGLHFGALVEIDAIACLCR